MKQVGKVSSTLLAIAPASVLAGESTPTAAQSPWPEYRKDYAHSYAQGAAPVGGVVRGAARGAVRGGYLAGRKGALVIDVARRSAATDKFIDHCLDNPKDKAVEVMATYVQ